jgi:hypothetical protein
VFQTNFRLLSIEEVAKDATTGGKLLLSPQNCLCSLILKFNFRINIKKISSLRHNQQNSSILRHVQIPFSWAIHPDIRDMAPELRNSLNLEGGDQS